MPRRSLVAAALSLMLGAIGLAVVASQPAARFWWWSDRVGEAAFSPEEQAAITRCDDPGWPALVRVLVQDTEVPCGPAWFAEHAAGHAEGVRRDWLVRQAAVLTHSPTRRARAASALLWAPPEGDGLPPLVALALGSPDAPDALAEAAAVRLAQTGTPAWADPRLIGRVAVVRLEQGDVSASREVAALLRADGLAPTLSAEARARAVGVALDTVGLDAATRNTWLARMDAGRSLDGPWPLVRAFDHSGSACRRLDDPACALLAADLLDRLADGALDEGEPEPLPQPPSGPPVRFPEPLWAARFDDPDAVAQAGQALGAVAAWVAAGPEGERPGRLLAALVHPIHGWADQPEWAGDPLAAAGFRRASPWATALAVISVAEVAGLAAEVRSSEAGLRVVIGDRSAHLARCGPAPAEGAPPPGERAVPADEVLANSTIEAALGALALGRSAAAVGHAALAERMSPTAVGVRGWVHARADLDLGGAVGDAVTASAPAAEGWWAAPCR